MFQYSCWTKGVTSWIQFVNHVFCKYPSIACRCCKLCRKKTESFPGLSYYYCYVVNRYQIPDDWPYKEARQLFKEPLVCTDEEQLDIKWTTPDEEVTYCFWFKRLFPTVFFLHFIYLCTHPTANIWYQSFNLS